MTLFNAFGLDGLTTIAFTPAEIRLRRSALCSAGPPFRFAILTELTLPLAAACALTEQIISSRQPLPTSVFETPRTYCACVFPVFAEAVTTATTETATRATRATAQRAPVGRNFIRFPPQSVRGLPGAAAQ